MMEPRAPSTGTKDSRVFSSRRWNVTIEELEAVGLGEWVGMKSMYELTVEVEPFR